MSSWSHLSYVDQQNKITIFDRLSPDRSDYIDSILPLHLSKKPRLQNFEIDINKSPKHQTSLYAYISMCIITMIYKHPEHIIPKGADSDGVYEFSCNNVYKFIRADMKSHKNETYVGCKESDLTFNVEWDIIAEILNTYFQVYITNVYLTSERTWYRIGFKMVREPIVSM